MARARPGIRRSRVRSPALAQRELHQLMHPQPPFTSAAEMDAILARLTIGGRFSAWVRSIGARLIRFRVPRKVRA